MERGTKGWSGADDGERKETELGCPMQNEIIIYCTHVLIKIKFKKKRPLVRIIIKLMSLHSLKRTRTGSRKLPARVLLRLH